MDMENQRTRMVLTDAGIDDALALIFLGEMLPGGPDYVACNGGNVNGALVANNCSFLKDRFGWATRLYAGSNPPHQSHCDASQVHGPAGLGRRRPPSVDLPPLYELQAALRHGSGPLDLLVLGPCSDVPALLSWPVVADRLRNVTVMGGAFEVEGNITPFAEFNVYMDPGAAESVVESDRRVVWVPLDATQGHLYTREEVLSEVGEDEPGRLVRELYDFCAAAHRQLDCGDGVFMHDVLAAAVWLGLVETTERETRVRRIIPDGEERGRIVHDPVTDDARPVRYVAALNHDGFLQRWREACRQRWGR